MKSAVKLSIVEFTTTICFFIFILISLADYAEGVTEAWTKRYNGPANSYDRAGTIGVDGAGNVYVAGTSIGSGVNYDYATIKYDSNGTQLWVARYNGPANGDDWASAMVTDGAGNVYVTGYSDGNGTYSDYTTIKYDSNGNELWVKRYNGPYSGTDRARAIAVDVSGNVYVTGDIQVNGSSFDYATIKYDTGGNEVWVRTYNGSGDYYDFAWAIAVDTENNVYVTGETYAEWTGSDWNVNYATIKYDTNGNQFWVREYDGPAHALDRARALAIDANGNVYITGDSQQNSAYFNPDYATIKYDPNGNELWVSRYNGPGDREDWGGAVAVDLFDNVYVFGRSERTSGATISFDYATVKYDGDGNLIWVLRYDGPDSVADYDGDLAIDGVGNVYVTGGSGSMASNLDYTTIKYSQDETAPSDFSLISPIDGAIVNKPYPYFSWNPSSDNESGLAKYQLYIDGQLSRDNIINWTDAVPSTALSNGSHSWSVRAWDNVGNYTDSITKHFSVSTDDGKIVFTRSGVELGEIYTMDADGNNQTRITSNSVLDGFPAWSPDGRKIAFECNNITDICIMDADGAYQVNITNNGSLFGEEKPAWSPDGGKIVFTKIVNGNAEIYVMNSDGSNQICLTNNSVMDIHPSWSPDGSKIVFASDRDGNYEIYVMNADGSNQTRLTYNTTADYEPSWSPDGTEIAYTHDATEGFSGGEDIYIIKPDGSNQTRLTLTGTDIHPSWSPDGNQITFTSGRNFNMEIYVMDSNGGNQTRLTNNSATDYYSDWGPLAIVTTAHTIAASAGVGGGISPSGAVSVIHGNDQSFVITPNVNYHVADVLVDSSSVGAVESYTFYNVTEDHTISASFALSPDITPPSTPGNLHWEGVTTTSVVLAWNPSTDNIGVAGYKIYNASTAELRATTNNGTSYELTALTPGASYSFYVRAYDAEGNQSAASNICGVTLPNSISTEPALPGNDVKVPVEVVLPSGGTATVTVEFDEVTSGGTVEIAAVTSPPASSPIGFRLLDTVYYINAETVTYTSPVFVTIHYDEPQIPGFDEANLRMFHWENGAWRDVTYSIDVDNDTITGQVDVLSPFVIGYPYFSGGGGYSTGANENMIAVIAILAISAGIFILRRQIWLSV